MNLATLFQQFADAASTDAHIRDRFSSWSQARREWCSHWTGRGVPSDQTFQFLVPGRAGGGTRNWVHPIAEETPELDAWRSDLNKAAPAERNELAAAFVRAIDDIERGRASMPDASASLGRAAGRHGFPLAALTPALSSLDPNRFVAVCDDWLQPLREFEGSPVLGGITEYDRVNTVALRWLAAAEGDAPAHAIAGYPAADRFGVFCGWLSRKRAETPAARFDVTKKKYKDWPPMW